MLIINAEMDKLRCVQESYQHDLHWFAAAIVCSSWQVDEPSFCHSCLHAEVVAVDGYLNLLVCYSWPGKYLYWCAIAG